MNGALDAQAIGYPSLFLLVAFGALVPIVPTGALVSGAAAVAVHTGDPVLALLGVFGVAALAAFLGDMGLYVLGSKGLRTGRRSRWSRWLEELRGRTAPDRLEQARRRLAERAVTVLVVSRLVPAGRLPVMVACLLSRMPVRRFARGNAPACLAWTVMYSLIGIAGGSLFPEPWEGVVAAVALTLLISAAPTLWRRLSARSGTG